MFSQGFGVPITPQSLEAIENQGTPVAGDGSEVIWNQYYDTQTYTSAATKRLTYFAQSQSDETLSNLPQGGQLPSPQALQVYQITLDVLFAAPVSLQTAVGVLTTAGALTDMAVLLMGSQQRPVWTLSISSKDYGPYSLTTLHGTGGPEGFGYGSSIATSSGSIQYARNEPGEGWNYWGNIIVKERANFKLTLDWNAAATLTATETLLRVSLFGITNRAVQ